MGVIHQTVSLRPRTGHSFCPGRSAPGLEPLSAPRCRSRGGHHPAVAAEPATRLNQVSHSAGSDRITEARKGLAGCVLLVTNAGDLTRIEGLVTPEDAAAAIEAGYLALRRHGGTGTGGSAKDAPPKSPYSQALVADMKALRLASIQGALLAKPELVLDLLAFALSPASGLASSVLDLRAGAPTIEPSQREGCEIDPRLTGRAAGSEVDNKAPAWNADLTGTVDRRDRRRSCRCEWRGPRSG